MTEETETTKYLYESETGDTLITNWYKAILTFEEKPVIKVSVAPNEGYGDRSDQVIVFGDNTGFSSIDIKQSAF